MLYYSPVAQNLLLLCPLYGLIQRRPGGVISPLQTQQVLDGSSGRLE